MPEPERESKLDSILAFVALGILSLSLLSLLLTLGLAAAGITFLPVLLGLIPQVGFPLGIILIFTLVTRSFIRRAREQKR